MSDDFGGFFDEVLQGGGDGAPGFKFESVNSGVRGVVTDIFKTHVTVFGSETNEAKLDKNGNKIPQLNVTLQTELRDWRGVVKVPKDENGKELPGSDDTGLRRVFLKYDMARAVGNAIQAAGKKSSDFKVGDELALKHTGTQKMPKGEMKLFEARYTPGVPTADTFFEESKGDQSAAPASDPWGGETPAADDEPPF